ncbi:MAG: D-alanyl-D-alanine carboxypeptidase [Verrucomicrobiales bacterium]|nr:D-alanyl-D-alanine carboxypeptidase [Verrucomicrobiales bacterium]
MRLFSAASLSKFASLSLLAGLGSTLLAVSGCQSTETQASAAAPQPAVAPQVAPAPNYPGLTDNIQASSPNLTFNGRPATEAENAPSITAKAAILVDSRGRVLYEKNADTRLPTASTQKLLLGIMIAERGGLSQQMTIAEPDTWAEPTKMGIKPGQVYTREELLRAVLIRSSNDIARALARDHSGSVSAFAANMNVRARQLGMHNSYFTNASGLPTPSGQYSTARDMAVLGQAALRNGFVRDAVRTKGLYFRFPDGTTKAISNTNQVLKHFPYCTGAKTGYTNAAGRCLVSSASYGGKNVVAVILGSKTPNVWTESEALLKYGLGM